MTMSSRGCEASWQDSVKHFARAAFSSFFKGDRTSTCSQGTIRHIRHIIKTWCGHKWQTLQHMHLVEVFEIFGFPFIWWLGHDPLEVASAERSVKIVKSLGHSSVQSSGPRSMIHTEESSAACGDRCPVTGRGCSSGLLGGVIPMDPESVVSPAVVKLWAITTETYYFDTKQLINSCISILK